MNYIAVIVLSNLILVAGLTLVLVNLNGKEFKHSEQDLLHKGPRKTIQAALKQVRLYSMRYLINEKTVCLTCSVSGLFSFIPFFVSLHRQDTSSFKNKKFLSFLVVLLNIFVFQVISYTSTQQMGIT